MALPDTVGEKDDRDAVILPPPPPPTTYVPLINSPSLSSESGRSLLSQTIEESSIIKLMDRINRIIKYDICKEPDQEVCCRVDLLLHLTPPILQTGPSCGFAALATLGQLLDSSDCTFPDIMTVMLEWAKDQQFTKMGEMFSAARLLETLQKFFPCNAYMKELLTTGQGEVSDVACKEIIDGVLDNYVMLIPYDKGPNHDPVLRNGHSAHWCVVLGLAKINLIPEDEKFFDTKETGNSPNAVDHVYALCRHGKSAHVAVWKLKELLNSCLGLKEMRPTQDAEEFDYIVSDRNDLKELRGRLIIINTNREPWRHVYDTRDSDS